MWEQPNAYYFYKIETSNDNVNWTLRVDKSGNGDSAQVQSDHFVATARYVRITVTGLPNGAKASIYDFKVFGETRDTMTAAYLPFDETNGTTAYRRNRQRLERHIGWRREPGGRQKRQCRRPKLNESICRSSVRRCFQQ